MEKAYEKLLTEHKLTIADLPADARTGIKKIQAIERAINMAEKKAVKNGRKYAMSASIIADIKTYDKWIVREILDYVEDKETNNPAPEVTPEEIIEEIKEEPKKEEPKTAEEPKEESPNETGLKCDEEFEEMIKAGKTDVMLEELKSVAPTAYGVIFDNYVPSAKDNGIDTTYFLCKEYEPNKFKLIKK